MPEPSRSEGPAQRLFHWNWCGHWEAVAEGAAVWQTEQAVARLPPWASVNSSMPPPLDELWQTLQSPIGAMVVWYWTA
jgi:hypothetical protein